MVRAVISVCCISAYRIVSYALCGRHIMQYEELYVK